MSLLASVIRSRSSLAAKDSQKASENATKEMLTSLQELTVFDADDAGRVPIPFKQILTSQDGNAQEIVIVSFLRRFGCPVCRAVATGLSYLKEQVLDPLGIRLIAVAIEEIGYQEFNRKQYFTGHVYVDNNGSLFQALHLKRLGVHNLFGIKDMGRMKAAVVLSSHEYFNDTRNFQGDYAQLGGLFIFTNNGEKLLFEFKEEYAGDTPLIADILKAINAPDNIRAFYQDDKLKVLNIAQEAIRIQKRFKVIKDHGSTQKLAKTPSYGDVTSPIKLRDNRSNSVVSVSNSLSRPSHIILPPASHFPSVQLSLTNAYGITTSPGHSPLSLTTTEESTTHTTVTRFDSNASDLTACIVPDSKEYFDNIFTNPTSAIEDQEVMIDDRTQEY